MFKKIAVFFVVGFIAITKAESNLFSLFKAQAGATKESPALENSESLRSDTCSAEADEIFTVCDANKSGLISDSEAMRCGGLLFWMNFPIFDTNDDFFISRSELYNAISSLDKYYTLSLKELTKEQKEDIPDIYINEVKSFLTANIFGGLESLISYKTQVQINQMFVSLDTNRDGKISKYELQTAARLQGEVI
jgi:Ca2+-binding EF-hand superfamily protein